MPAVLVLGGDGMLGHVVVQVLRRSAGLRVEHTARNGAAGRRFDVGQGPGRLRALLRECGKVDHIVNCIGIVSARIAPDVPGSVREALAVNSVFPYDLAAVAASEGIRVLHVSTDGVFSGRTDVPYVEDADTDADDLYGRTKSLGEVVSSNVLNVRCSIIGSDPVRRRGLLEWFLARPAGSAVDGYVDQSWNGVTSRQFAELCAAVIGGGWFERLRVEGAVHHYCPNEALSKYDLLTLFREIWKKTVTVRPATGRGRPVHRVLGTTREGLPALCGRGRSMRDALNELLALREDGGMAQTCVSERDPARWYG